MATNAKITAKKTETANQWLDHWIATHKNPDPVGSAITNTAIAPFKAGYDAAKGVVNTTESIASFLGKLTEVSTWIRVAEVLGGAILLIMGLRQLASVASGSQQIKGIPTPNVVPVPV